MAKKTVGGVAVVAGSWLCWAVVFWFLLLSSEASAEAPVPLNRGDRLDDGWSVSEVVRHPEYVRFKFERSGKFEEVEIIFNESGPGEWATYHYRLQPSNGSNPPEPLLNNLMAVLRKLDKKDASEFFVSRISGRIDNKPVDSQSAFNIQDQKFVDIGSNPVEGVQTLAAFKFIFYPLVLLFLVLLVIKIRLLKNRKKTGSSQTALDSRLTFILFWLVQLLPLIIAGFLTFDIYESVSIVNSIDKATIINDLRKILRTESAMTFSLLQKDGKTGFYRFGWEPGNNDSAICTVPNKFISLERAPDERAIYIFGGSPVLLPDPDNSMVDFVARGLSERTGEKVRSYNFGMCGITSVSVEKRALEAMKVPPDLVIIYNGVNDYSFADNFVARNYFIIRDNTVFEGLMYWLFYIRFHLINHFPSNTADKYAYPFYRQDFVEPVLNRILRDIHFIEMDESFFIAGENVMFENYLTRMSSIISAAGEAGVPVLMIPAAGNFMERPFGVSSEPLIHYVHGLKSRDYNDKAYHMLWAREGCYFNKLIRAKLPLYDRLYNLEFPNLYVFDLEYNLLQARFPFDFTSFMDQAHMHRETHEYISHFITDYILQNDLCCGY